MSLDFATAGLGFGIAVAAALGILGHYGPASGRWRVYLFRPLAGALILSLALIGDRAAEPRYFWGIAAGLLFALVGDVLLMLPRDLFLYGLVAFAVTHVCFLAAFTSGPPLAAHPAPFVVLAGVAAALVSKIWQGVGASLRIPVIVYVALLVAMASQAWSRHLELGLATTLAAAVGGTLFLGSDGLLSLDRFGRRFRSARLLVLATFYAADGLIALSVLR